MAGTGATSLDVDSSNPSRTELCKLCRDLDRAADSFAGEAPDDGIVAFFDALMAADNPPGQSLLLYNFPRMTGITLHAALADRLMAASGDRIFGMKDSSNDAQLQAEIVTRRPEASIFPGSESDLREAKRRGAAGCISGSVALWPRLAKSVFEDGDEARAGELTRLRASLDGVPLVGAVRYLAARSARRSRLGARGAAAMTAFGRAAGKLDQALASSLARPGDRCADEYAVSFPVPS